jgi:hypothetical protein
MVSLHGSRITASTSPSWLRLLAVKPSHPTLAKAQHHVPRPARPPHRARDPIRSSSRRPGPPRRHPRLAESPRPTHLSRHDVPPEEWPGTLPAAGETQDAPGHRPCPRRTRNPDGNQSIAYTAKIIIDAVIPLAGICARDRPDGLSLPTFETSVHHHYSRKVRQPVRRNGQPLDDRESRYERDAGTTGMASG